MTFDRKSYMKTYPAIRERKRAEFKASLASGEPVDLSHVRDKALKEIERKKKYQ